MAARTGGGRHGTAGQSSPKTWAGTVGRRNCALRELPARSDRRSSAQGAALAGGCAGMARARVAGGVVDAVGLARRFGLGGAARLSDGPVARGQQDLRGGWTRQGAAGAAGRRRCLSAGQVRTRRARRPHSSRRPAPPGYRRRRCGGPPGDASLRRWEAGRSGCTSGSTCVPPIPGSRPQCEREPPLCAPAQSTAAAIGAAPKECYACILRSWTACLGEGGERRARGCGARRCSTRPPCSWLVRGSGRAARPSADP